MYIYTNDRIIDCLLDKWSFDDAFELISDEFDEFFIANTVYDEEIEATVTKHFKVTAVTDDIDNEANDDLLSMEGLKWLHSVRYERYTHEERMALIKAAMIAYPNY